MRIKVHDDNLANKFDTLKKGGWDLYEHYEEREFILNEVISSPPPLSSQELSYSCRISMKSSCFSQK